MDYIGVIDYVILNENYCKSKYQCPFLQKSPIPVILTK